MKIMSNLKQRLDNYREKVDQNGFTMLDAVITAALVIALAVGGFMVYKDVINNTKANMTEAAAAQVASGVVVYENDDDAGTNHATAAKDWTDTAAKSSKEDNAGPKIKVETSVSGETVTVTATHEDGATATKTVAAGESAVTGD